MEKLTIKDRKILYELDTDSRQPYNKIGKRVGLSKDSVSYRIERLKRTGIIKQFHTLIDVGKLGFTSYRLYIKLQNTTPQKYEEIVNFLKDQKIVAWLISIDGDYDLGMWLLSKSLHEINVFWKYLFKRYINYIDKKWLTIFTRVSYFPRTYLLDRENMDEYVFVTEPKNVDIDTKDIEILKMLAVDARVSVLDISRKVRMTPKTISLRIKNLEKNNVIIGYRTMFDLEKLGYQHFKLHINLHNITEEKENQFRSYVKKHPNIIYDNEVLGGDDLEIEIQASGLQQLRTIIDDIKGKFSEIIKNYKYMLFYKEHKFVFFPVRLD